MVAMSLAHATAALLLFMMSAPSSAAAQQVRFSSFSNNGDAYTLLSTIRIHFIPYHLIILVSLSLHRVDQ
jgi:hypothetical protein